MAIRTCFRTTSPTSFKSASFSTSVNRFDSRWLIIMIDKRSFATFPAVGFATPNALFILFRNDIREIAIPTLLSTCQFRVRCCCSCCSNSCYYRRHQKFSQISNMLCFAAYASSKAIIFVGSIHTSTFFPPLSLLLYISVVSQYTLFVQDLVSLMGFFGEVVTNEKREILVPDAYTLKVRNFRFSMLV